MPEIANALKVDAVVEGSVVRAGDMVRITAQLIDARTDRHLWAQSFEGRANDILALQDTISEEIAAQTKVTLQSKTRAGKSQQSVNPAAYDAYLRGLFFFQKQDFDHSVASFHQAIAIDPAYSAAYAELATALDAQSIFHEGSPKVEMEQALAYAKRAIQLDPENGMAYTELGSIQTVYSWDWPAAEQNLLRGISLSPSSSIGEMKYAVYLDAVGRPEEAVEHMRRSLDLDPMSFFMTRRLGVTLYLARHYRESLATLNEAAEMEPEQGGSFDNWLGAVYEMEGRRDEAVRDDIAALHMERPSADTDLLEQVYRRDGWKAYWRARLDGERPYAAEQCVPYSMALSSMRIGDDDGAFVLFNRALDQHCYAAIYLKSDPRLDPIRGDARFVALLRRINFQK
ncbi:MAG TPA: hypothetical protein VMV57_02815 [Terracidiphilus sp.]|nr:hypothetical protein [Terracidiphilus sp.]